MANIYDKSSLVLIPSGTKTGKIFSQKPVSGDGDFTFTRASAATRVNADGNIEKETSNSVLQSNTFSSATWIKQQSGGTTPVVTSGFTDPNGGSNAWRLQCSISGGLYSMISQGLSTTGLNCNSIWIKSNTGSNQDVYFRINNSDQTTTRTATTTWQRIEVFTNAVGQSFTIGVRSAATGATSSCDVLIYAAQTNQGLIAQEVLTTTTTALYGGITDNTPRLDYTDSSCPALLLEPQRTNYVRSSEYYDTSANYILSSGVSVEDNFTTSPEGVQNASKVTLSAGISAFLYTDLSGIPFGNVTISCWAKADSAITIGMNDGSSNPHSIDLTTEWQRFEFTYNYPSGGGFQIDNYYGVSPSQEEKVFYLWGLQAEAGSYATSYIPTYGTSVSRVKDSCVKTGVSSLIGQTEGTLFVDVKFSKHISEISDGTSTNRIVLYTDGSGYVRNLIRASSVTTSNIQTNTTIQAGDKIALAYSNNDSVIYKNGVQIGSDTSVTIPATSKVNIGSDYAGNAPDTNTLNQTLLFKTRLSNEELATLTTI